MTSDTPISIVSRFETKARKNFVERLAQARKNILTHLTRPHPEARFDVRAVTQGIIEMTGQERYVMFRHVMRDHDGADTLDGMEALHSFIANSLLDDAPCTIAMDPEPADLTQDVYFMNLRASLQGDEPDMDETELNAQALAHYRERERPLVLLWAKDDDKVAGPDDILKAIESNRELDRKWAKAFAEFMEDDEPTSPSP